MAKRVIYINPPSHCDICSKDIISSFTDGVTKEGYWANMCPTCFKKHGVRLGTGYGQRYTKDGDDYIKTAG